MLAGIFLLSSCDAVTEPDITSSDEEPFSKEAARTTTASTGDTELFNCYVSQFTADGTYVEKLAKFPLPTSLGWTENDELTVALYRNVFPGTTLTTRIANCRIPDHPDALNYLADLLEADVVGTLGVDTFSDEDCDDDVAFCGDLEGIEVTASRCDNETALSCGGNGGEYIGWHWDDIFDDWNDDNPHEWEPVGGDPEEPCEDCLPPEPCDTDDPIIDDEDVQEGMEELRDQSNWDSIHLELRNEAGGWITQVGTDDGISYEIVPFDDDDWSFGPCSIEFDGTLTGDDVPGNAVGMIHVHPWSVGEDVSGVCDHGGNYPGGPSLADIHLLDRFEDAFNVDNFQGYVIDKDKIWPYDSSSDLGPNPDGLYRCGY